MIRLNTYIKEELEVQPINEGLLLLCLCGAILSHFAIKGMKKASTYSRNFWDWALGEKNISMSMQSASESLNEDKTEKFDKKNVQPAQIDDPDILEKIIQKTEPANSKKSKKGFYVFQELLKDDSDFKKINKAPYFPNYVLFMDAGDKDHEDKKPNFYGMAGFSVRYWKQVSKKGKDENIKKAAKNYIKYLHVFAVQTDPQFAKQGLFDVYLETLKKAVKELKLEGITIKCEDDQLAETFKKYGFEKVDGLEHIMVLGDKNNDKKEE